MGLRIDELSVLAEGFDESLVEGRVQALDLKKRFRGAGVVGTENIYLVTPKGGRSLTENHPGLLLV